MLLCLYCAQSDLDDGVILNCKKWKKTDWIIAAGVKKTPADDTELWHWEGDNLHLHFYSAERISAYRARSEQARTAILTRHARNRAAKEAAEKEHTDVSGGVQREKHGSNTSPDTSNKINKMNEKNEPHAPAPAPAHAPDPEPDEPSKQKASSLQEVIEVMTAAKVPGVTARDIEFFASQYYDDKQSCGWTYQGLPLIDWKANARKWLRSCAQSLKRNASKGTSSRNQNIYPE